MERYTLAVPDPTQRSSNSQSTPPARLKRPRQIAQFSYDDTHAYHPDASSLKYYYDPPYGASLSHGYPEKYQMQNDERDEHLDGLLRALADLERQGASTANGEVQDSTIPARLQVDLVTWRGMMTKILTAPYAERDGFEMNATCFQEYKLRHPPKRRRTDSHFQQGTIFLEENHAYRLASRASERSWKPRPGMLDQDLMTYWGYKFEALSLLPRPWAECSRDFIESREEHVVSNAAQYCSVVETGAGDIKVVLGGEVDGVWDQLPMNAEDRVNWVELKTSAEIRSDRDAQRFENKLLKFWAQSFLLGVPRIVVGFRTNTAEARLVKVQEFETTKIPKMVGSGTNSAIWDSNLCIQFVADFLRWVKEHIKGDGVWRISRKGRSNVVVLEKIEEAGHGSILSPDFLAWRSGVSPSKVVAEAPLIEGTID